MPRRVIGREVTQGTICRDHWRATVTVTVADVLPAGVPSPLLLSIAWRDRDSGAAVERDSGQKVKLELVKKTPSGLGALAFAPADGASPLELVGDVPERVLFLQPSTTATSLPAQPDVALVVTITDSPPVSIDLKVAPAPAASATPPADAFRIVAEGGGTPPPVLGPDQAVRLTTASRPAGSGLAHRWIPAAPAVEVRGAADGDLTTVGGHFAVGGTLPPLRVWALYGPAAGEGPVAQAVHLFQPGAVRLRLTARVTDLHPTAPATEEVVPGAFLREGGNQAQSGGDGRVTLEAWFAFGELEVRIERTGVTPRVLRLACAGSPGNPTTVTVTDPSDVARAPVTATVPAGSADAVEVALGDRAVLVHKLRGTVLWPDTRVIDSPPSLGTPLARRRVYAVPLADGPIPAQRPADSRTLAAWKNRPDVLKSNRPGRAAQAERTADDGAWELRFVELNAGRRWFIWVESVDPDHADDADAVEQPEYVVRTHYVELLRLTGTTANQVDATGYHLVDHTHNLSTDAVTWGVETLKVVEVDVPGTPPTRELRALRPARGAKVAFDGQADAGERVALDAANRVASGFTILALPLVPVFETPDARSAWATQARDGLLAELDAEWPRGHWTDAVRWVLDTTRIDTGIDLSAGAWDGAWVGTNDATREQSRQRRRCELLEKTYLLSPLIPSASIGRIEDARWRPDAVTLADFAPILPPAAQPSASSAIGFRRLGGRWAPVLAAVSPRLTGLGAGRHLLLFPGHGFFASPATGTTPVQWRSDRGGWNFQAGEDENDAYMSMEVQRVGERNGLRVTNVREPRDTTLPGVTHTAASTFTPSPNRDFLRLWQQNAVYYLGFTGSPASVAPFSVPAGNKNTHGISSRSRLASLLGAGPTPMHIIVAVHTNAGADGTSAEYLDVATAPGSGVEANTLGRALAQRLVAQVVARCSTRDRGAHPLRSNPGHPVGDLQRQFNYFFNDTGGDSTVFARALVGNAGWTQQVFPDVAGAAPLTIPVALVEVVHHDDASDAARMSRAWFRRRAGEAIAMATEEQLRAATAPATRADLVSMLRATFGPTASVAAVPNDATPIAGTLAAHLLTATGVAIVAGGGGAPTLEHAAVAVDDARAGYSRLELATAIRDAFAAAAGYASGTDADAGRFITTPLAGEDTLDHLPRQAAVPTRDDAGGWVSLAMGWTPANANTAGVTQVNGVSLLPLLGGAPYGDRAVARVTGDALATAIRAVRVQDLVRVSDIALAAENGLPLAVTGTPEQATVARGVQLTFVAKLAGVVPRALVENARFVVTGPGGFRLEQPAAVFARDRLMSTAFAAAFPAGTDAREYTVAVTGQDPRAGTVEFARRTLRVAQEG